MTQKRRQRRHPHSSGTDQVRRKQNGIHIEDERSTGKSPIHASEDPQRKEQEDQRGNRHCMASDLIEENARAYEERENEADQDRFKIQDSREIESSDKQAECKDGDERAEIDDARHIPAGFFLGDSADLRGIPIGEEKFGEHRRTVMMNLPPDSWSRGTWTQDFITTKTKVWEDAGE